MSYFSDASLVFIPSAQKSGKAYSVKPTDGTGDLTFTRSNDTATRVNSAGLIEKVRTNLLLQSNQFDTTWTSASVTLTANQPDKDGGTNAWRVQFTGGSNDSYLYQPVINQLNTGSIYVKGTAGETALIGVRTSVGGGSLVTFNGNWQRITDTNASNGYFVISDFGGATATDFLIMNAQVEAGDIATDYIATTSAAVSVGPVANVPRLDYLNSSCPRLLLEPQRQNGFQFSEQADNAYWTKTNCTISANNAVSPDGYTNADKIVENTATGLHGVQSGNFTSSAGVVSVFVKAAGRTFFNISEANGAGGFYNLTTGAATGSFATASMQDYGNGWWRCVLQYTFPSAFATSFRFYAATSMSVNSYAGDGSSGVLIYGAQFENGAAYATSYIPTLGAAVTRGADAASKSSINALIGGTSGTIFFEIKTNKTLTSTNFKQFFYYTDASASQAYMYLNGSNYLVTNPSLGNFTGSLQFQADTTYKVALAYATNDFKLYINGVERGSSTSGTPINALNLLSLGSYAGSAEFNEFVFSQYIHFPTRLSNSDLAALTA